ncbi:MAG TPA: glycosyltransferase [Chryseolinea sp.]|nr:glycosyltransferase [Chryseolinea sp.]
MIPKKTSIAIIIPGGIGTGKGNLGVPVLERLVKLLSKDFEITVFSLFKINKDYHHTGFELIDVSHRISLVRFVKLFLTVRQHHKKKTFRVIHGFWALPSGMFAVILAGILNVKSIVSILGGDAIALPEISYGQLQRPLARLLILWTLERADEVVVLTKYLLDNLKKAGLTRERIQIIPWGIDTWLFAFQPKQIASPIQFLHIANLNPVKDQETLLRSFKLISDKVAADLTIIGEGVLEPQVKALVASLNINNITFIAPLPYELLPEYYNKADILLHTSLSEGQSEVVAEAMSSGVLVCGTKVGLMYDEPSCCIAVDVRDHVALADKVLEVLKDPALQRKVVQSAQQWSNTHSIHWTVDQLAELYKT